MGILRLLLRRRKPDAPKKESIDKRVAKLEFMQKVNALSPRNRAKVLRTLRKERNGQEKG